MLVQSPNAVLDAGAFGEWCVRAFADASLVAGRLSPGSGGAFGEYAERALALRMGALLQHVPPYRALRGVQSTVADGWADGVARRYESHSRLAPPFRHKAADMRPAGDAWIDLAPARSATVQFADELDGQVDTVLTELMDRARRYFARHSTVGVIGGAETGLARVCLMLARFEAGVLPEPGATVEQIHRGVPDDEVREVVGLVRTLHGSPSALPRRASASLGVAEPVFVRGSAEGDLVVDGTLIAVCLGDHTDLTRKLRHLVAHAWLDTAGLYRIRDVGVYLAAVGTLVTWPVAELAELLLSGGDPGTARAEFLALADREITVPRPVKPADATLRRGRPATVPLNRPDRTLNRATPMGTVYGPEEWDTVADAEWTYWDLWLSVMCVVHYGGDWDALDAGLYARTHHSKEFSEALWCHVVDLKDRLAAVGLTAADLVGDLAGDRQIIKKARSKILDWKGIQHKHFSPAMRDAPSRRYHIRAHFGSWDRYPVSPRPFYDQLAEATPFDLELQSWGLPTFDNIDPLFRALEELEAEHATTPSTLLAVRRAGLTASSLARHRCDDSHGDLGMHVVDATLRFSRTDWRTTGIDPAVFWRDVFEIFTMLGRFGYAPYEHEHEIMANLGADRDRPLIKHVVDDLTDAYVSDRLTWAASDATNLWKFV